VQVLGAGDALGGPAHTGVNFGGNPANLGASPHDWGFAKKKATLVPSTVKLLLQQTKKGPVREVR